MRGKRIFESTMGTVVQKSAEPKKAGRSSELHAFRNDVLLHRYYFYSKLYSVRLAYDEILRILSVEFALSPFTIAEIITGNTEILKGIIAEGLTVRRLSQKFPHLNWKH